jgi:hypothetical protein
MSYTFTTLEIDRGAFEKVLKKIRAAGREYVDRYYFERDGKRLIHFTGSEVALVTPLTNKKKPG